LTGAKFSLALYGLPVSIKSSIEIKSIIRMSGFAAQLMNEPAENDAIIVDILKTNG
jgi:Asp-tRNA(Asn)/Glu-tRNA(Gln) amidotransferase A subunit family amidase